MRLLIQTQIEENYGAHCWDGTGDCPQYWKMKGGNEYVLPLTIEQAAQGQKELNKLVFRLLPEIEKDNDHWREYLRDWQLLDAGEQTPDEILMAGDSFPYAPKVLLAP